MTVTIMCARYRCETVSRMCALVHSRTDDAMHKKPLSRLSSLACSEHQIRKFKTGNLNFLSYSEWTGTWRGKENISHSFLLFFPLLPLQLLSLLLLRYDVNGITWRRAMQYNAVLCGVDNEGGWNDNRRGNGSSSSNQAVRATLTTTPLVESCN